MYIGLARSTKRLCSVPRTNSHAMNRQPRKRAAVARMAATLRYYHELRIIVHTSIGDRGTRFLTKRGRNAQNAQKPAITPRANLCNRLVSSSAATGDASHRAPPCLMTWRLLCRRTLSKHFPSRARGMRKYAAAAQIPSFNLRIMSLILPVALRT